MVMELDIKVKSKEEVSALKNKNSVINAKKRTKVQYKKTLLFDKTSLHKEIFARVVRAKARKFAKIPYGIAPLFDIVEPYIITHDWNEKLIEGAISNNWEQIVGKKLAKYTNIKFKKDTLFIYSKTSSVMDDLPFFRKKIADDIEQIVGVYPKIAFQVK
jgi:hypothetical protein